MRIEDDIHQGRMGSNPLPSFDKPEPPSPAGGALARIEQRLKQMGCAQPTARDAAEILRNNMRWSYDMSIKLNPLGKVCPNYSEIRARIQMRDAGSPWRSFAQLDRDLRETTKALETLVKAFERAGLDPELFVEEMRETEDEG